MGAARLSGRMLSWRRLLPGSATHTSVKWIERLEVTEEPGSYDAGCARMPDAGP